jgi:nucleotide-binding universal stress UspA family protein
MKILLALDRSEYTEIVLEHGLDQAAHQPDAELHVVTAVADERQIPQIRAWLDATVRDGLDEFSMRARPYTLHVLRGRPAPVIGALAEQLHVDLLVIGRFKSPSSAETILAVIDCPTLVVGVEGHVLEPQCRECRAVRRASEGETLFCEAHAGDRVPDFSRAHSALTLGSRMW